MTTRVLITGFAPFGGSPFNPSEALAAELARRPHPTFARVSRSSHIFRVSYEAVDRELPALLRERRPDALIMFGLAARTKHLRIETCARNRLSRADADMDGRTPASPNIDPIAPAVLPLRAPTQRLLLAARSTGLPIVLSRDAGHYLCNYLCWRAAEASRMGGPRLLTFIHVPLVPRRSFLRPDRGRLTLQDLIEVGETVLRTVIAARP